MARQKESTNVVDPFVRLLKSRGWECQNIVGSQNMSGLPDYYVYHKNYGDRWIEFKVYKDIKSTYISTTDAQKIVIPKMLDAGVRVYAICSDDLRGSKKYTERMRMYKRLITEPPNAKYLFHKEMFHLLK